MRGPAFFAYSDNYLIDVKFGIIMDVEASRAIRQAEVGAAKTMIERTEQRFDIKPERLAGDTAYGSGANLNWLVNEARRGRAGLNSSSRWQRSLRTSEGWPSSWHGRLRSRPHAWHERAQR